MQDNDARHLNMTLGGLYVCAVNTLVLQKFFSDSKAGRTERSVGGLTGGVNLPEPCCCTGIHMRINHA